MCLTWTLQRSFDPVAHAQLPSLPPPLPPTLAQAWDYVFDVDIAEGAAPRKLAFNRGDNPYLVADRFLLDEELPSGYRWGGWVVVVGWGGGPGGGVGDLPSGYRWVGPSLVYSGLTAWLPGGSCTSQWQWETVRSRKRHCLRGSIHSVLFSTAS